MGRVKIERESVCEKCNAPIALVLEFHECYPADVNINLVCAECKGKNKFTKKEALKLPQNKYSDVSEDCECEDCSIPSGKDVALELPNKVVAKSNHLRYIE
mgnify:CR=1 FL=1